MKKFSEEWFQNNFKKYKNITTGYPNKITEKKGYKPNLRRKDTREQRVESLYRLAEEKGIKLDRINLYEKTF